ncbi:TniQ protein [Mycolicibacterium rutilum]|uniref:TniQ protein n=1 Tax=Mycolicibacterium rutilum TaxID=370526 RepID=A0A1H6J4T4_MYCRU|nr:TniQ family protein [Mycolicibacterium rutilum]SEH55240.1 TniQ protein [Mycolicibacterium rutilum]
MVTAALLPVRVKPASGECIDSWLDATAAVMGVTLGDVSRQLHLPIAAKPQWIWWLPQYQLDSLQVLTGTPAEDIATMTLDDYAVKGLPVLTDSHEPDRTFPFGVLPGSRFCPECLHESSGRWRLVWRLGWSFACTTHGRLLAAQCPSCGEDQRRRQNYTSIPMPTKCRCGCDLTSVPTPAVGSEHDVVVAQRFIGKILSGARPSGGVLARQARSRRESLEAVRSLANRTINFAARHGLATAARLGGGFTFDELSAEPNPSRGRSAVNSYPSMRTVEAAVGITVAVKVLGAETIEESASRLRWLVDSQDAKARQTELLWCRTDDALAAAITIKASRQQLGAQGELRYRAATPAPEAPRRSYLDDWSFAATLPALMWPTWCEKLLADTSVDADMRRALSIATLIVGSNITIGGAEKLLSARPSHRTVNEQLELLYSLPRWNSICRTLISLSDYLVTQGSEIDYARRRKLVYSARLEWQDWLRIRGESADETLPRTAPQQPDQALVHLRRLGIDEPVEWHPPLKIIGVADLT